MEIRDVRKRLSEIGGLLLADRRSDDVLRLIEASDTDADAVRGLEELLSIDHDAAVAVIKREGQLAVPGEIGRLRKERQQLQWRLSIDPERRPSKPRGGHRCRSCHGTGQVAGVHTRGGAGAQGGATVPCPDCDGTGSR